LERQPPGNQGSRKMDAQQALRHHRRSRKLRMYALAHGPAAPRTARMSAKGHVRPIPVSSGA